MDIMLVLLLLCIILVVAISVINYLYKRTNYYKSAQMEIQKFVDGVPDGLDIVNTGSSYACYGFEYEHVTLKGFNLALPPQPLEYDQRLLQHYAAKMNLECIVLIVLCPFEFFCDHYADIANTKYYSFLPPELIDGYSGWKKFTRAQLSALSAGYNLRRIIKDTKPVPFHDAVLPQTDDEVLCSAQARARGWQNEFKLINFSIDAISNQNKADMQKNRERLNAMLAFCKQKQFRPVVVIPPVTNVLSGLFTSEFCKAALYDNIAACCDGKDIPVLDYYIDSRLQAKELYVNADFLNAKGRKQFSQIVFEDLGELGYIKARL